MKTTTIRSITTKSGKVIPEGTPIDVCYDKRPNALLIDSEFARVAIPALAGGRYLRGFLTIEKLKKYLDRVTNLKKDIAVTISLTGAEVEPDGWDEHGFPSVLIAANLI